MKPLQGCRVLNFSINLPGPLAGMRLAELGAKVIKVEPPEGDPLAQFSPQFYKQLTRQQQIVKIDAKQVAGQKRLTTLLKANDLFLTSFRPQALTKLQLSWTHLHKRYKKLAYLNIVGKPKPFENEPGHDLTYQAEAGLLAPPQMPGCLISDLVGAEIAVSEAVALLYALQRGKVLQKRVCLAQAAQYMALPKRFALTASDGILGGGHLGYNLYQCQNAWVALAALEKHFWEIVCNEIKNLNPTKTHLVEFFKQKTAEQLTTWAKTHDIPLVVVAT